MKSIEIGKSGGSSSHHDWLTSVMHYRICIFFRLFSVEPLRSSVVDSLFVLDLHGNLTEYVLEPQGVKTVPQSDDTPLELITTSRAQWTLTR